MSIGRFAVLFVVFGIGLLPSHGASAAPTPLALTNGTADFSQTFTGNFSPDNSVNGVFGGDTGWAIDPHEGSNHVAAWNSPSFGSAAGTDVTFVLSHTFGFPDEVLGHFRVSVTNGGTVDGNDQSATSINALTWTQLTPLTATASHHTMSIQGDNSILVTDGSDGSTPDTLVVTSNTTLTGITAIRLEALTFGTSSGPGLQGGNFVLSEFQVFLPEPSSCGVLVMAGLAMCRRTSGRRKL